DRDSNGLKQTRLASLSIGQLGSSATRHRAHPLVDEIDFADALIVHVGHEQECAVEGERDAGWRIESRIRGDTVGEAGNSVAGYRLDDSLSAVPHDPPDAMVARIGEVDHSVRGNQNIVGQTERRDVGGSSLKARDSLSSDVEFLLLVLVCDFKGGACKGIDRDIAAGSLNPAHNAVAVLGNIDSPTRIDGHSAWE